jgi:hypothetical protein
VYPLDLSAAPADIRELLARAILTETELERVKWCRSSGLLAGQRVTRTNPNNLPASGHCDQGDYRGSAGI